MVTKIQRIVVATDFSDLASAAVRRATELAALHGASLDIVHAFPVLLQLDAAFAGGDWPARLQQDAEHRLQQLRSDAAALGVNCATHLMHGSAHRMVGEVVERVRPDLIVIGAHARGLVQQFFLGGTAARILASAPCPVLIVRYAFADSYRRALAAIDFGPRSAALLDAAMRMGSQVSLTVAHAFLAPMEARMRMHGSHEAELRRHIDDAAATAQRAMAVCLEWAGRSSLLPSARVVHGDPNPALPDLAREIDADLIVVGRHSGSRMGEAILGSVPRFLAYNAPCDVLVV